MTTHIRLDEAVYAKIQARKRDDETFSEAIDRLVGDWSLAEWGERFPADEEELASHLAALERIDDVDRERFEEALAGRHRPSE